MESLGDANALAGMFFPMDFTGSSPKTIDETLEKPPLQQRTKEDQ